MSKKNGSSNSSNGSKKGGYSTKVGLAEMLDVEKDEVDMGFILHLGNGILRTRQRLYCEFVMMSELVEKRLAKQVVIIDK